MTYIYIYIHAYSFKRSAVCYKKGRRKETVYQCDCCGISLCIKPCFCEKTPLAGHRNAFKNPLSSG